MNHQESIVFTESEDGLGLTGLLLTPAQPSAELGFVWVHGNTGAFADWPYVQLGRAIAAAGLPFLSVDTRGHHISTSLYKSDGSEIAGGSAWERLDEAPRDIAPWVAELAQRGVRQILLAGHSQGAAKVIAYAAERADPRIAGLVLASPSLRGHWAPELAAEAARLVAAGEAHSLLTPIASAPWYQISADNLVSREQMLARVYRAQEGEALIGLVTCQILAFFGLGGDVGGLEDLELIRTNARRSPNVETILISGANHVYTQVEAEVATQIINWAARLQEGSTRLPGA